MLTPVAVPSNDLRSIVLIVPSTSLVVICRLGSGFHIKGLLVLVDALSTSFKNDASTCLFAAVGALRVRLPPHETVPRKFVEVAKEEATPWRDRYMRSASSCVMLLSFVALNTLTSNVGKFSVGG